MLVLGDVLGTPIHLVFLLPLETSGWPDASTPKPVCEGPERYRSSARERPRKCSAPERAKGTRALPRFHPYVGNPRGRPTSIPELRKALEGIHRTTRKISGGGSATTTTTRRNAMRSSYCLCWAILTLPTTTSPNATDPPTTTNTLQALPPPPPPPPPQTSADDDNAPAYRPAIGGASSAESNPMDPVPFSSLEGPGSRSDLVLHTRPQPTLGTGPFPREAGTTLFRPLLSISMWPFSTRCRSHGRPRGSDKLDVSSTIVYPASTSTLDPTRPRHALRHRVRAHRAA